MKNNQLPLICQNFILSIEEDIPTVKLYKYRYFLATYTEVAFKIFDKMTAYALEKKLVGQYEAIHEVAKRPLDKVGVYKDQRQDMVDFTNPIRHETEHAQSIGNLEEMVSGYFRLAEYYKKIGMHRQSASYYSKIFRSQSGNKVIYQKYQYFSSWAQELYLDNDWTDLNIFIRNQIEDPKLVDCSLALIKDLKYVQLGNTTNKFFENVLTGNYPINAVIQNKVISYIDLGTIYSLVALAKKDRQFLKVKTLWSSKLEVLYLKNDFRGLLEKIQNVYEKQGRFHPLIDKISNDLIKKIRQRVLEKYLSIYQTISLAQIQQNTTYSEGQLRTFLKSNRDLPYLIDPITQSVMFYEKTLPLYEEASNYSGLIKEKFKEHIRNCLNARKAEQIQANPIFARFSSSGSKSSERDERIMGRRHDQQEDY